MFLVTAVEDQGHARCELRRTPVWRSSQKAPSTTFVNKAYSPPGHLLKYGTSANSVPSMKPLGVRHGCDVVATIDALRAQKYIAYPPENWSCARATSSVPSMKDSPIGVSSIAYRLEKSSVLPSNERRTAQYHNRPPQHSERTSPEKIT